MPAYPGLGLHLLHHSENHNNELRRFPMSMHPSHAIGDASQLLLVREVAMMIVMDRLTDKPDFHIKVFDEEIVKKWKEEALAIPIERLWKDIAQIFGGRGPKMPRSILNEACMDYCIQELRHKAEFFKKTGIIPTLEGSASTCKSDTLVDQSLHDALLVGFAKLKEEQADNPDWHPRTDDTVQDLVHPSLYPLIFGKTRAFQDPVVGVEDAIDKWAGKGEIIPETGASESMYWSTKFQWLPANVKFREDGSLEFTSYINNLHPVKHRDTYQAIEKLLEKAMPLWDSCLTPDEEDGDEKPARAEPRFPLVENGDDENGDNWDPSDDTGIVLPPRNRDDEAEVDDDDDEDDEEESEPDDEYLSDTSEGGHNYGGQGRRDLKWKMMREAVFPDPPEFKPWDYGVKEGNSLRDRYQNLQVIVKMASIELTPEKPEFPPGSWHLEGQMNERIIGTALYYLDSENVTPSYLQFRMQTDSEQDELQEQVGQDAYEFLERCYATDFGNGGQCLQSYGSIETKQGRMLAFPNIFQHRVSPFGLKDMTKPGHRRFIALWLVDPDTPIISTANVPPQQQSWWLEKTFGSFKPEDAENLPRYLAEQLQQKLPNLPGLQAAASRGQDFPAELSHMVAKDFQDAVPMSLEEAKQHRLDLMDVRSVFQVGIASDWENMGSYNFCEH